MHAQDAREAEARRLAASFTMRIARRRFVVERRAKAVPPAEALRAWARRTYNPSACAGKLAVIVAGRPQ